MQRGRDGGESDSPVPADRSESVATSALSPARAKSLKPRYKPCKAPKCGKVFEVRRFGQATCETVECALAYFREQKRQKALKQIRAERQVYRTKNRTIKQCLAATQKEFNRFIRERDFGKACICCDRMTADDDLVTGSRWDAGHYRSVGAAPHLRFNEDNCHRQLVFCNQYRSGNHVEYRQGLIARIGLERVEALENDNTVVHWTREGLDALRRKYVGLWKALKAQRESA